VFFPSFLLLFFAFAGLQLQEFQALCSFVFFVVYFVFCWFQVDIAMIPLLSAFVLGVAVAADRTTRWAWHATTSDLLDSIRKYGLVPDSNPRLRSSTEGGLYFSDDPEWIRGYGGADVLIRFPWPLDAEADHHPISGRTLAHCFVSATIVPPDQIEVMEAPAEVRG
jgi:hypothetical protein